MRLHFPLPLQTHWIAQLTKSRLFFIVLLLLLLLQSQKLMQWHDLNVVYSGSRDGRVKVEGL